MRKTSIGGQALIEGVMMRGDGVIAMAVRDEGGEIRLDTSRLKTGNPLWKKIPIVRGVIAFFDSMISGVKILLKSSEVFMEEDKGKKATNEKSGGGGWFIFFTLLISIGLSVGLFFLLPNLLTDFMVNLLKWNLSPFLKNLIDGFVRLFIFVMYMFLVSKMKDIHRVFQYHGAEHKTINCFEHEMEMTVENVKKCSKIHDRCGTSFMFFVMFVSILVFSLVGWSGNTFVRLGLRLALLPVVAGVSYELLKLLAKTDCWIIKPFKWPGQMLQKLSTKEPDDKMIEVALASFNAVLNMQNDLTIPEVKFPTIVNLSEYREKAQRIFVENGIDEFSDLDWILCEVAFLKRNELKDDIKLTPYMQITADRMLNERLTGKPLQYIIGNTDFFGYKLKVSPQVLIPRFETELLVDKTLAHINGKSKVLDLCCGSGAIGLTISLKKNCEVTLSDVSVEALKICGENARSLNANVKIVSSNLFENITDVFDVVVSNPPYIPSQDIETLDKNVREFEPLMALDGGIDGLDFYRQILEQVVYHLSPGGIVAFELGINQMDSVIELAEADFRVVERIKDYNNIDRILILQKTEVASV